MSQNSEQALGWLNDLESSRNISAATAGLRKFIEQADAGADGHRTPEELKDAAETVNSLQIGAAHLDAAAFEDETICKGVGKIVTAAAKLAEQIAE